MRTSFCEHLIELAKLICCLYIVKLPRPDGTKKIIISSELGLKWVDDSSPLTDLIEWIETSPPRKRSDLIVAMLTVSETLDARIFTVSSAENLTTKRWFPNGFTS